MATKNTSHQNTIIFKISGDKITREKFSNSIRTFFEIIEDIAASVTGKRKAIEWIISVKSGSIGLCATAEPISVTQREATKTIKVIEKGIKAISKRKKPPRYFSDNTLEKLYYLGNVVGLGDKGISQISIQTNSHPNEISPSSVAFVSEILKTPTMAYGTVEGRLLALELKGRLHFGIDEILTGKRIKCFFGDEIYNDVLKALRQRVSAYGLIRYQTRGIPASVEIKELTVFPEQSELPQFEDIIGLLKD
jgi:hypothetical protein